ncbi:MAG: glycosyltransferase family 2 protein [Bacteroidetes bacterium]|nr:glycosyltransferase family 2 protein [Bacteroidota bacterium]
MTALSIVIITFNEEKNIQRCLESVRAFADEIVVVDSFSTDQTKKICLDFGARFIEQTFLGYIEQKNFALDQATNDYVLSLDADEAISEPLALSIQQAKKDFSADGYHMNRCASYAGKWIRHGSWYPDTKLRLFNRKKARWGGENPHDKVIMQTGKKVSFLKGDILHYTYASIEEHITQMNRFTTIQAEAMLKNGKKATLFKLLVNPPVAFFSSYIIKLGFLDGRDGLLIAKAGAYATFIKYIKLWHRQRNLPPS